MSFLILSICFRCVCTISVATTIRAEKLSDSTPAFLEKLRESAETFRAEMTQESAVCIAHRLIQSAQEVKAICCDSGQDHSAVLVVPAAGNQLALLHTVEQARYIRIACNHAVAYFAACQSRRAAPQYPKYVVLSRRKIFAFQELCKRTRQHVRRAQQIQVRSLFREDRSPRSDLRWDWAFHISSIFVVTTIVKTDILGS
jgi:hypothetical protein